MGLRLTYGLISGLLVKGFWFDATAAKIWKTRSYCQYLTCEKLDNMLICSNAIRLWDSKIKGDFMYICVLPDHTSKLMKQSFLSLQIKGRTYLTLLADRFFYLNKQKNSKLGQYRLETLTNCTKPLDQDTSSPLSYKLPHVWHTGKILYHKQN